MLILPILAIICTLALWVIFGKPKFLPHTNNTTNVKISIIIPARDEENNISILLKSINIQTSEPHEIIVVNDGSTDQTAIIAQKLGATVINARPPLDNWKGKPSACQQGAQAASGSWLLFLDADTYMASTNFLAQLSNLTLQKNHVFSICPWHQIKYPYEQLSAFFNLLMVIGIDAFGANQSKKNDTRLVGQSMLISKLNYEQCKGHSTVKSDVLENFHLSKTFKKQGIKRTCYLGKNNLHMRMFPGGFTELWSSWKKGFTSGASATSPRILIWTTIWITGMIIATTSTYTSITSHPNINFIRLSISAYIIHATLCYWAFRKIGSFSIFTALFFPITLAFHQLLFFSAIIDQKRGKKIAWKGRDVN